MNISYPPTITPQCRYCTGRRATNCYYAACNKYENQTAADCFALNSQKCAPGPFTGVVIFYIIIGSILFFLGLIIASMVQLEQQKYEDSRLQRFNSAIRLDRSIRSLSQRVLNTKEEVRRSEEVPTAVVLT